MARDILSILADMKPPKKSKFEEEEEDLARMRASGPSPLFLPKTVKQRREAEDYAGPLDMPSKPPLTLFGGDPNVGGMKPPPGKPREGSMRVHSSKRKELGEMIARVSGTPQMSHRVDTSSGLPSPKGPKKEHIPYPDPFSVAAQNMNPLGLPARHIGAVGSMASSFVPGVGPLAAGALGGLGGYGLTTTDEELDPVDAGLSAALGGIGGLGLSKLLPAAAKWAGSTSLGKKAASMIPNLTNDARVAAELGQGIGESAAGSGGALSSRVAAPGPAASPSPQALPQGPRATIVSSEPLSGSSPALGWQSSPGRSPLGVGGPSKPMALNPPPPAPGGSPPQLGPGFKSEGFMPDALTSPLRPRPPMSPGFMPDEATQGMAFRPLQAPRIPEIPGEPLPWQARVGGGAQTAPARPPPPPMSGTPPMPVRAAMPRGGAPAPPQGLDSGIGDAAISEIRAGGGLPRPAPSHPFFQSMPEPSLPDTFIRPSPALNAGSPLAPPLAPPPGLPGGVAPNAGQGSPSLFARANSGDPRALALATALGLPLAGAAGYGLGRGASALFSSPSAAPPLAPPSPFALQRPDLSRLQPIGEEPAPRPKKKKKKPKS